MTANGPVCIKMGIEYEIRKYQRGIRVAHKIENPDQEEKYQNIISRYASRVTQLKKFLLAETGRCSPSLPAWPV